MSWSGWYRSKLGWIPRPVRQIIVLVIGGTVLLLGLVMFIPFIPGPGFIVIPIGLAILALEFAWATRWLLMIRRMARDMQHRVVDGWTAAIRGPWPAGWLLRAHSAVVALLSRRRGRKARPDSHSSLRS